MHFANRVPFKKLNINTLETLNIRQFKELTIINEQGDTLTKDVNDVNNWSRLQIGNEVAEFKLQVNDDDF